MAKTVKQLGLLLVGRNDDEGRHRKALLPRLSSLTGLLDEVCARDKNLFTSWFAATSVDGLWEQWSAGVETVSVTQAIAAIRAEAFAADHGGEANVEVRNSDEDSLVSIQPGTLVTLAAILEYLVLAAGPSGKIICKQG